MCGGKGELGGNRPAWKQALEVLVAFMALPAPIFRDTCARVIAAHGQTATEHRCKGADAARCPERGSGQ